jgi:predicted dehydrogenase
MKQATFGIIGVGGIAQAQHLPNMIRAPHIRLKTLCDLRQDLLGEMQHRFNVPEAVTDHTELLADPEIDAVIVATKEDMQVPLSVDVLKAGKHVYTEKPLADKPEDVEAIVSAQKESGKLAGVGFNRRMAPAYTKAKEILYADGGPRNIHYRLADEYWEWGKIFPPGFRVVVEVCHIFDLLRWFTNSNPVSIYCVESRDDDEVITLKFESGCVASIMNCGYMTMDMPKEHVELVSDLGGVIVEEFVECRTYGYKDCDHVYRFAGHTKPERDATHKYLLEKDGAHALRTLRRMGWETRERYAQEKSRDDLIDSAELRRFIEDRSPHWNYMVDKGWMRAIDHFAECILDGRKLKIATAEDGLWSSRMSAAAVESRTSGEVVRF